MKVKFMGVKVQFMRKDNFHWVHGMFKSKVLFKHFGIEVRRLHGDDGYLIEY